MCETCIHAIKMALNSRFSCNCPRSEFFRENVSAENYCGQYDEKADRQCAMDNGRQCRGLIDKHCDGCKFYKTKAQLDKERKNTNTRLRELSDEHQVYIKETFKVRF